jgi:hypothetical protein
VLLSHALKKCSRISRKRKTTFCNLLLFASLRFAVECFTKEESKKIMSALDLAFVVALLLALIQLVAALYVVARHIIKDFKMDKW